MSTQEELLVLVIQILNHNQARQSIHYCGFLLWMQVNHIPETSRVPVHVIQFNRITLIVASLWHHLRNHLGQSLIVVGILILLRILSVLYWGLWVWLLVVGLLGTSLRVLNGSVGDGIDSILVLVSRLWSHY